MRPELENLVRALAALPAPDRRDVVAAAERGVARTQATLSWDLWDRARGVVSLGGDAVEDSDRTLRRRR
jgi:hypothetical protein